MTEDDLAVAEEPHLSWRGGRTRQQAWRARWVGVALVALAALTALGTTAALASVAYWNWWLMSRGARAAAEVRAYGAGDDVVVEFAAVDGRLVRARVNHAGDADQAAWLGWVVPWRRLVTSDQRTLSEFARVDGRSCRIAFGPTIEIGEQPVTLGDLLRDERPVEEVKMVDYRTCQVRFASTNLAGAVVPRSTHRWGRKWQATVAVAFARSCEPELRAMVLASLVLPRVVGWPSSSTS